MRVLLVSYAERTHFYTMVPVAWALRTAGHEVRVAAPPALVDDVVRSGLTAVPVGTDVDWAGLAARSRQQAWPEDRITTAVTDPQRLDLAELLDFFADATDSFFRPVNEGLLDGTADYALRWRPDLVLWEQFTFAGAVAARACGAAHARVIWGCDVLGRMRRRLLTLRGGRGHAGDALGDWLATAAGRHGGAFAEDLVVGDATIEQAPESLRLPVPGVSTIPVRYVPYNGPAEVPGWLAEPPDRPRVCITAGITLRNFFGADVLPIEVLHAFEGHDVEVVATLVGGDDPPPVPDNVRLVDFVPLHALLPTCSAVVHIGGAGAMSTAVRYAVPQLVLVSIWDTVVRARMLRDQGAGLLLGHDEISPESIKDSVLRLVGEAGFAESARLLRQQTMHDPTPNDTVAALRRLAESGERAVEKSAGPDSRARISGVRKADRIA